MMTVHMMKRSTKFQAPALWMREPHRENVQRLYDAHGTLSAQAMTLSSSTDFVCTSLDDESMSQVSSTAKTAASKFKSNPHFSRHDVQPTYHVTKLHNALKISFTLAIVCIIVVFIYQSFLRKMIAHHKNNKTCKMLSYFGSLRQIQCRV